MVIKTGLTLAVVVAITGLSWAADHFHDKASEWRTTARQSQQLARQQAATITDINQRQQQLAALDKSHTEALASAQHQIDDLQRDVDAGHQRLQLHANCPAMPAGKPSGTRSLGHAAGPALTADAERDYWRLRSGISTLTNQVIYLQDYIRQQCLN